MYKIAKSVIVKSQISAEWHRDRMVTYAESEFQTTEKLTRLFPEPILRSSRGHSLQKMMEKKGKKFIESLANVKGVV